MSLVIITLILIVLIFIFAYDTKDKRSALNSIGLDLSESQIQKSEEHDLNKRAKYLISEVKAKLNFHGKISSATQFQQIYDFIEGNYENYNNLRVVDRALEILKQKVKDNKSK